MISFESLKEHAITKSGVYHQAVMEFIHRVEAAEKAAKEAYEAPLPVIEPTPAPAPVEAPVANTSVSNESIQEPAEVPHAPV